MLETKRVMSERVSLLSCAGSSATWTLKRRAWRLEGSPKLPTVIGMFDLKYGADPEEYERWARSRYAPAVRSFPSRNPYFFVIEVNDLEGIGRDLTNDCVQILLAGLHEFADPRPLVVAERFA
jgi:hypothetical protein